MKNGTVIEPRNATTAATSEHDVWTGASASVSGRKHLREGIPCQDASVVNDSPRPFLVVADGRGSAKHSEVGAQSACEVLGDLVHTDSLLLKDVLDGEDQAWAEQAFPALKDLLFRSVLMRQKKISEKHDIPQADLEHTLLFVVLGTKRWLSLHVGDGAIVVQSRSQGLRTISAPERGEFANSTCFVGRKTTPEQVRAELHALDDLTGVVAMSDGTAERLIHSQTNEPAIGVGDILRKARSGVFGRSELLRFLTEPFWEPLVMDDRSLAFLVPVPSCNDSFQDSTKTCKTNTGDMLLKATISGEECKILSQQTPWENPKNPIVVDSGKILPGSHRGNHEPTPILTTVLLLMLMLACTCGGLALGYCLSSRRYQSESVHQNVIPGTGKNKKLQDLSEKQTEFDLYTYGSEVDEDPPELDEKFKAESEFEELLEGQ
jgi:hypothetical protein